MYTVSSAINSQEDMQFVLEKLMSNKEKYRGGTLTVEQASVPGETNKLTLEITVVG